MTEQDKSIFTDEIELQRFKQKKTQQNCADVLGVSLVTYRMYEKNPDKMSINQALTLGNYLKWNLFDFFFNSIIKKTVEREE